MGRPRVALAPLPAPPLCTPPTNVLHTSVATSTVLQSNIHTKRVSQLVRLTSTSGRIADLSVPVVPNVPGVSLGAPARGQGVKPRGPPGDRCVLLRGPRRSPRRSRPSVLRQPHPRRRCSSRRTRLSTP